METLTESTGLVESSEKKPIAIGCCERDQDGAPLMQSSYGRGSGFKVSSDNFGTSSDRPPIFRRPALVSFPYVYRASPTTREAAQLKGFPVRSGIGNDDLGSNGCHKVIAKQSCVDGCTAELVGERREVQEPAFFQRGLVF